MFSKNSCSGRADQYQFFFLLALLKGEIFLRKYFIFFYVLPAGCFTKKDNKKKERERERNWRLRGQCWTASNSKFIIYSGPRTGSSPTTHFLLKSWDNRTQQLKGSGTNPFPLSHLFILCGIGEKKKRILMARVRQTPTTAERECAGLNSPPQKGKQISEALQHWITVN